VAFQNDAFENDAFQVADISASVVTGGLPPGALASHARPAVDVVGSRPSGVATAAIPFGEADNPKPRR
jgi:hypothetical protein